MKTSDAAQRLKEARELVERCAEVAYDVYYEVTPETSQNAYCFEKHEDLKEEWRSVVRAIFREVENS